MIRPRSVPLQSSGRRGRLLWLVVIAITVSNVAYADLWYENYAQAKEALDAEDWDRAYREALEAAQKNPKSSPRARTYGVNFIPYFPHLRLGIAYYHLERPDLALESFATEERLGAIQGTEEFAELEQYRQRIQDDRESQDAQAESRKQAIIDDGLARSATLRGEGRLDEAVQALSDATLVAPDHPDIVQALADLRQEIQLRQDEQAEARQIELLVAQGRASLARGDFQEAASSFNRALNLRQDPQVKALFDDAQKRLADQVATREDEQIRQRSIVEALGRAAEMEKNGDYAAALSELQSVYARDPDNSDAAAIERRLLQAQASRERETQRRESLTTVLAQAKERLDVADYSGAMWYAQGALAIDGSDATALQYVSLIHGARARDLLGENPAPAIAFLPDDRERNAADMLVREIRSSRLQLTGTVSDDSAVTVQALVDEKVRLTSDTAGATGTPGDSPSKLDGVWKVDQFRPNLALFTLDYRGFDPGPHTISIIATDEDGLVRREDYRVDYVVPFWRLKSVQAAAAVLLVGLGAALMLLRVRKRNKLLKRRFNPYVAGAPVLHQQHFYGRDQLLEKVLQTVHNNSILLYGERRIGKTSLQHQLKRRLKMLDDPKIDFYPVFIDLQGTPQDQFFSHMAEEVFEELEPLLGEGNWTVQVGEGDRYGYREFVRDIKRVIDVLKKRSSKQAKLVLQLDEVDTLNDYDPRINQRLRSLFMRNFSEHLVCVMSGVGIQKHWESQGSPWYNFFEELQVASFRREDAVKLIERPVQGVFRLDAGVTDRIIELSDCKPYLIQRMCVALVGRLHDEKRRRVTLADVDSVGRPSEDGQ